MCVMVLNFFSFGVACAYLGGDALNGGEVNGHYYVQSSRGRFEVTRGVFTYSRLHAVSVMAGTAIYFLAWPCLYLTGDWHPVLSKRPAP